MATCVEVIKKKNFLGEYLGGAASAALAPSPGSPQCSWPAAAAVECRMH